MPAAFIEAGLSRMAEPHFSLLPPVMLGPGFPEKGMLPSAAVPWQPVLLLRHLISFTHSFIHSFIHRRVLFSTYLLSAYDMLDSGTFSSL